MEEKRIYYIYKHYIDDPEKPFYIGMGKNDRAWRNHLTQPHWIEYINNRKWNYEIIKDKLTYKESNNLEKEYIKLYGRIDKGTGILINLTNGGSSNNECNKGKIPWNKGKKISEEKYKENQKQYKKEYRKRPEVIERTKQYRKTKEVKERKRIYYIEHREEILLKRKIYLLKKKNNLNDKL